MDLSVIFVFQVFGNPKHPLVHIVGEFCRIGDVQTDIRSDSLFVNATVGETMGDGHRDLDVITAVWEHDVTTLGNILTAVSVFPTINSRSFTTGP